MEAEKAMSEVSYEDRKKAVDIIGDWSIKAGQNMGEFPDTDTLEESVARAFAEERERGRREENKGFLHNALEAISIGRPLHKHTDPNEKCNTCEIAMLLCDIYRLRLHKIWRKNKHGITSADVLRDFIDSWKLAQEAVAKDSVQSKFIGQEIARLETALAKHEEKK